MVQIVSLKTDYYNNVFSHLTMAKYIDENLNLLVIPKFLTSESADGLFRELEQNVPFGSSKRSKEKFRSKVIYGDPGLIYKVVFRGNEQIYPVTPWSHLPILKIVKSYIEQLTGIKYNCCVIQRYPNGNIGMNPHRDKEMIHGTLICGLSLGETRNLKMARYSKNHTIPLPHGSLYIICPPTNDYWSHEILKDESTTPRISLTFRNYADHTDPN